MYFRHQYICTTCIFSLPKIHLSNFRWVTSKSYKKAYATSKLVKCPEDCYTPRVAWPLFRQEAALVALQLYPFVDQLTEWPLRPPLNLPFLMTTTLLPSNLCLQGKIAASAKGLLCNNPLEKTTKYAYLYSKDILYNLLYTILRNDFEFWVTTHYELSQWVPPEITQKTQKIFEFSRQKFQTDTYCILLIFKHCIIYGFCWVDTEIHTTVIPSWLRLSF